MYVYIDESGDLGWKFDKPYRSGGSSRFLTIAYIIIPSALKHLTKREIIKFYQKYNLDPKKEFKGNSLNKDQTLYFCNRVITLLNKNSEIEIGAMTVKKENVLPHIRNDSNKLYNYMINLALIKKIKHFPNINFCPDPRTIKVQSGNSLVDYLTIKLWFEENCSTTIKNIPQESHCNKNIQFIDYIAYIIWSKYESNKREGFELLKNKIENKELFF